MNSYLYMYSYIQYINPTTLDSRTSPRSPHVKLSLRMARHLAEISRNLW